MHNRSQNPAWTYHQSGEIGFFSVDALTATGLVTMAFSSRRGGVSQGRFASLNQGLHVGDHPHLVLQNRRLLAAAVGIPYQLAVVPAQVHGEQVKLVERSDAGAGAASLESSVAGCDALVTREVNLPLVTHHADCVALFILDPRQPAIGLAHAGWKGTAKKIGIRTVEAMQLHFGTRPEDCLVGISPSIGPCCYEVGPPVLQQFAAAFSYYSELIRPAGAEKAYLDLWEANRRPLLEIGIKPERIFVSRLCTCCLAEHFYSYRRETGGVTGRMAAIIMLKGSAGEP